MQLSEEPNGWQGDLESSHNRKSLLPPLGPGQEGTKGEGGVIRALASGPPSRSWRHSGDAAIVRDTTRRRREGQGKDF